MKTALIFISSLDEAKLALKLINRLKTDQKLEVVCSSAPALLFLQNRGIKVTESQIYYRSTFKTVKNYQNIVIQSKALAKITELRDSLKYRDYYLGEILEYSFNLYLAEVSHSQIVAEEILHCIKPDIVYVSSIFTESPARQYQSAKLNCVNIALYNLAKSKKISTYSLGFQINLRFINSILITIRQFFSSSIRTINQLSTTGKDIRTNPTVVLANHYQLMNFQTVIEFLKINQLEFTAIGKASDSQVKTLAKQNISYINLSRIQTSKPAIKELRIILFIKFFLLWFMHIKALKSYFSFPGDWDLIKWKLFYFYIILIPQITENINLADSLFSQRPKILLTTATNDTFSKCFALSAKKYSVKVIEILHGLIFLDEDAAFRCNDEYGIWGPAITPLLDTKTIRQNTVIVGYPYKLELKSPLQIHNLSNAARQKLRIRKEEKVLLILGSFPIAVTRFFSTASIYSFIRLVIQGVADTKEKWNIIVRSHPSNTPDWLDQISIPPSVKIFVDNRQMLLSETVAASDFVISNLTTALLEPMMQNKPHLLYLFENNKIIETFSHPLISSGAIIPFNTSSQLTKILSYDPNIIASRQAPAVNKFLEDYCSVPAKISSSQKIYNIVQKELAK